MDERHVGSDFDDFLREENFFKYLREEYALDDLVDYGTEPAAAARSVPNPERKHLTDLLKMVAYQAESDLVRLLAPHYRRTEQEGRTLIQSALAASGDLEVTASELASPSTP